LTTITALTGITSDEIEVTRGGDCHFGCTWYISFIGEKIDITIAEGSLTTLTSDATITPALVVTVTRALSKNYRYVPIPSDLLFTLESKPTVTVKSNGILGGCLHFNCEYKVDAAITPTISSYTYTPEATVAMTIATPVPAGSTPPPVTDDLADAIFTS
jgi:hypothetical protein